MENLWCSGTCVRALADGRCSKACMRSPLHEGRCACEEHRHAPLGTGGATTLKEDANTFASLLNWAEDRGGPAVAMRLRAAGIASLEAVRAASPEALLQAGIAPQLVVDAHKGTKTGGPSAASTQPQKKLRQDHPVVRASAGGRLDLALAAASTADSRAEALKELHEDMYAASGRNSRDSIWTTWCTIAQAWRIAPLPLTAELVTKMCASFKKGQYRSPQQYVSRARLEHVRTTRRSPSPAAKLAIKDCLRSARRGIGPAALKDAIRFEDIGRSAQYLKVGHKPSAPEGAAIDPVALTVLGTWWFTRGIELSAAKTSHVRIMPSNMTAAWSLPASKTDIEAHGEERIHGCCCAEGHQEPLCPYHVMVQYLEVLKGRFGEDALQAERELPLFPCTQGRPLSKAAVRNAVRETIAATGAPLTRRGPDGKEKDRFGEHVMRVMAAQFLARRRVDLYRIQLLARWGSDAVLRYVQDAPLAVQEEISSEVMLSPTLRDVTASVTELRPTAKGTENLAELVAAQCSTQLQHVYGLVRELVRRMEAKEAPEAAGKQDCVRNDKSGAIHRILVGSVEVPSQQWATYCPWKFGQAPHAVRCGWPGQKDAVCSTCFPDIAAERRGAEEAPVDSGSEESQEC